MGGEDEFFLCWLDALETDGQLGDTNRKEGEEEVEEKKKDYSASKCRTWLLTTPNKEFFFFLLQAILAFLSTKMVDWGFDIWSIPEFSGAATDLPIMECIENVELVCELCEMKRVKRVLPLWLRAGALAGYWQFIKEQRSNTEQIKQVLISAYMMDPFNTFEQFTTMILPKWNSFCQN